jgi:hypothetical protein
MSGSSGSSGLKTILSAESEDLKKIVRELSLLDQLRAGDHVTTPILLHILPDGNVVA